MNRAKLDIVCDALDELGVPYLRAAPQVDTAVVELQEGYATFQWHETAGYITAVHTLYPTDQIPIDVRNAFVARAAEPGPPDGVLAIPDQPGGLTPGYVITDLAATSTPEEAVADVRHRLAVASRYANEVAALAQVSTWDAAEVTVEAITSAPSS